MSSSRRRALRSTIVIGALHPRKIASANPATTIAPLRPDVLASQIQAAGKVIAARV